MRICHETSTEKKEFFIPGNLYSFWNGKENSIRLCCITNDGAENYLQTIHDTMTRISAIADTIIKLDNQPARTSGINKKMRKMIQKFQNLNNSTSLLQIAMQDSIADVIGTSRKIETVSSYTQYFTKVKDTASALQAAARSNNKQS